tara:strand:- start:4274 stop:4606 length:333 start_codon:yes stop_codon:yes gene_type:complete
MFSWIALCVISSFGVYSLHYFITRTRTDSTKAQNAEAINLVSEMVRLWRVENLSASQKQERLNDIRERMIDFCDRRAAVAPVMHEDNVAYLNVFGGEEDSSERGRKSSGA